MARYYKLTERGKNFLQSGLALDGGFEDSKLMRILAAIDEEPTTLKILAERGYDKNYNFKHQHFRNTIDRAVKDGYIVFAGKEPVKPVFISNKKYRDIKDALSSEKRKAIHSYIEQHPGAHFNDIRRELGIGNGAMQHHSQILLECRLIKSVKDRMYTRYFLADVRDDIVSALIAQISSA